MTPFNTLESRYERDPEFHTLVQHLEYMIHKLQFTPSELREAVMYAAFRFEMRNPQAIQVRLDSDTLELMQIRERVAGSGKETT